MKFQPGSPKVPNSGRKPGTPNKVTQTARDKAEELGVDPYEVLLLFAKGDWQALGYQVGEKKVYKDGIYTTIETITPEMRLHAAKEAVQYILPKKKSLDITTEKDLEIARRAEYYAKLPKQEQLQLMKAETERLEREVISEAKIVDSSKV